ncbi:MAG: YhcH/YjgK/YiaL family protein [Nitrospinae bacterium]|nr:YhcH/YjgK/YiaL family protein [Nitrospinota bacterium]
MILEQLCRHRLIADPRLTQGFRWLAENPDPAPGRHELADGAYVTVADYETAPAEGKRFEAHKRFIDIQLVTVGEEQIDVASLDGMAVAIPYADGADIAFYDDPSRWSTLALGPCLFAVFYPDDAHRPGVALPTGAARVRKVVVKIPVGYPGAPVPSRGA